MSTTVAAVDFGATSIRVCRVELGDRAPRLQVVHRAPNAATRGGDGHLRWDWPGLVAEMERGLARALDDGPVASIGVDTWGVDYGLLDRRGDLVEAPFCYRDERTRAHERVVDRIGARRLYGISGLQNLAFNTIFQLAAHDREPLARARHVLMLPELLVHHLTGVVTGEPTSAGTTGLLDLATLRWSAELCDAIDLDPALLPSLQPAATPVGTWRGVPVHLVGGHDTASAVVAGASEGEAFVSSGTWSIVGCERPLADTSEHARCAGFSNEQGALGGVRFLRNVTGWWLVDQCRQVWGGDVEALLAAAARVEGEVPIVDVDDPRFLAPADMVAELRAASGLADADPAVLVRSAVESMALAVANVVAALPPVTGVQVFGGGAASTLFLDALRQRSGLRVTAGPIEATALGNAIVQGIALGVFPSLEDARAMLSGHEEVAR
ncbi:MAG TPA: FGGY-family carbohydrate kinase [Acidimicrobiia bacterium]|nr:FGGY-family carbohydrate kinase [Acidimicrobiia bacterium]